MACKDRCEYAESVGMPQYQCDKACQHDGEPVWKPLWGFVDPPAAPEGYETEVRRDSFLGIVISYRHVPIRPTAARHSAQ